MKRKQQQQQYQRWQRRIEDICVCVEFEEWDCITRSAVLILSTRVGCLRKLPLIKRNRFGGGMGCNWQ